MKLWYVLLQEQDERQDYTSVRETEVKNDEISFHKMDIFYSTEILPIYKR